MGGINLGAFIQGAAEGYEKGIKMNREQSRYDREQQQWKEEDRQLNARKEYEAGLATLRNNVTTGGGDFAHFMRPDVIKNREAGIQTPGEEQAKRANNPLMNMGEGLYTNQDAVDALYYSKLADLTEKYYSVADPAKAALVREDLIAKRDAKFERRRKEAVALAMNGQREGLVAAQAAYKMYKDGRSIDVNSGVFDEKTMTWKGLNIINDNGEVIETRDLNPSHMASILYMSDPMAWEEHQLRARDVAVKEGQLAIETQKAPYDIDALRAKTSMESSYGRMLDNQLKAGNIDESAMNLFDKAYPTVPIPPGTPDSVVKANQSYNHRQQENKAIASAVLNRGRQKGGGRIDPNDAVVIANAISTGNTASFVDAGNGYVRVTLKSGATIAIPATMIPKR